jgi:hypothetical protein
MDIAKRKAITTMYCWMIEKQFDLDKNSVANLYDCFIEKYKEIIENHIVDSMINVNSYFVDSMFTKNYFVLDIEKIMEDTKKCHIIDNKNAYGFFFRSGNKNYSTRYEFIYEFTHMLETVLEMAINECLDDFGLILVDMDIINSETFKTKYINQKLPINHSDWMLRVKYSFINDTISPH